MAYNVTLVRTSELDKILGFWNWKKKIEKEGGGSGDVYGGGAKGGGGGGDCGGFARFFALHSWSR